MVHKMFWKLTVMKIKIISFSFYSLFCVLYAESANSTTNAMLEISSKLSRIDRANVSVENIEKHLALCSPVFCVEPDVLNPMWSFGYKTNDIVVELFANTEDWHENFGVGMPTNRTSFYYTGYFRVFPVDEEKTNRRRKTFQITRNSDGETDPFSEYLHRYDMINPISVFGLEQILNLGKPTKIEPPAFIDPMWSFYYQASNHVIRICGTSVAPNPSKLSDTRDFIFTGFWSVKNKGQSEPVSKTKDQSEEQSQRNQWQTPK